MTLAFARHLRLRRASDIQNVFAKAYKRYTPYCQYTICRNDQPHPRIAIMISRKQVKTAVARNRIRRTIRESFRHEQAQLAGFDIIVSVRKAVLGFTKKELRQWFDRQWPRLINGYNKAC